MHSSDDVLLFLCAEVSGNGCCDAGDHGENKGGGEQRCESS